MRQLTFCAQDKKENGNSITNWASKDGEFKRQSSQFRNFISRESGAEFPPEKDRYHLYVSYACPWGEYMIGAGGLFFMARQAILCYGT